VLSKLKLGRAPDFLLFHLQNFKSGKSASYDVGVMETHHRPRKASWTAALLQIRNLILEGYGAPKTDVKRFEII
jgi:hypothetical protein